jgi:hypothetical protein
MESLGRNEMLRIYSLEQILIAKVVSTFAGFALDQVDHEQLDQIHEFAPGTAAMARHHDLDRP